MGAAGNPFDYQRPLTAPADLIDREDELFALQQAAADRVAIRLSSPRRYGKTSLLRAHLAAMAQAGHRVCFVDLDRVGTVQDVAARLASGLEALSAEPGALVERRLSRIGVTFGTTGITVQVAPRRPPRAPSADEARAAIRELLAIPAELAADGTLTVVAIDEFQDLLTADDHLDGLMRSVLQHQAGVAYVFAGSAPTLMRQLFSDRERPFYGQARPLDLPPLPEDETFAHVRARLPEVGARDPATRLVVQFAEGHPQRTMLLAHHLYNRLDTVPADPAPADAAISAALAEVDDVCASLWIGLDRTERAALVALADGEASPASRTTANAHGVARSTMQRAVERLEADGQLVMRTAGGLRILDPLFAEWIRRR